MKSLESLLGPSIFLDILYFVFIQFGGIHISQLWPLRGNGQSVILEYIIINWCRSKSKIQNRKAGVKIELKPYDIIILNNGSLSQELIGIILLQSKSRKSFTYFMLLNFYFLFSFHQQDIIIIYYIPHFRKITVKNMEFFWFQSFKGEFSLTEIIFLSPTYFPWEIFHPIAPLIKSELKEDPR